MHRPRILLIYAMSVDGKISPVDGSGSAFTSRADRQRLDRIRAGVDLIVVGAETLRRENPPFTLRSGKAVADRVARGEAAHPDVCILTRSALLPAGLRLFHQTVQKILVACPDPDAPLPPNVTARLEKLVTKVPFDPSALLASPALKGYSRILVEGGGRVNAFFVEAGFVDEIHVTLSPVLLGGERAPTPVAGTGLGPARRVRFDLLDCERAGAELFLHYRATFDTGRGVTGEEASRGREGGTDGDA